MVSKILLRLIDEAIIPAFLVIAAKIFALLFLIQFFGLDWQLNSLSIIPTIEFSDPVALEFVNSYSNLFMYLVALAGFGWVLIKAYHLHETHISPRMVLDLLSWDFSHLISDSYEVYPQAIVWLSYIWLITLLILFHSFIGINFLWMLVFVVIASVLATWYLIDDIEREMEL